MSIRSKETMWDEILNLKTDELYELMNNIRWELWRREHPNLSQLNLSGFRGKDSKNVKEQFTKYGLKIPRNIIYSYLTERDAENDRELSILEFALEIAKSYYNNINKKYVIALDERDRGAQGSHYYLTNYFIYPLNKEMLEWLIYKMLTTNSTKSINVLPQASNPIKPLKIVELHDYYSSFGGMFSREWISVYEITVPFLLKRVFRNGPDDKVHYSINVMTEAPTSTDIVNILKQDAYPFNPTKYNSIDDRVGLLKKYKPEELLVYEIGSIHENLYGDDYDELYIITTDNKAYKAHIDTRVSVPAEVGYCQEYPNRLVIYNMIQI
jgi:hypothetical protein